MRKWLGGHLGDNQGQLLTSIDIFGAGPINSETNILSKHMVILPHRNKLGEANIQE